MPSGIDFMREPAIDVHGHVGNYGGYTPHRALLFHGEPREPSDRAAEANVEITLISALTAFDPAPDKPADVEAGNALAMRTAEQFDNLLFYAVANPRNDGWQKRTEKLLEHPRCAGVKLHPRWNYWDVTEYGDRVFDFMHRNRVLTLSHTGDPGNAPSQFVPFANKYPNMKLILAHIGNDQVTDRHDAQVAAVEQCTQGNVWTDTSSAASMLAKIIELAVERIGADRI